MRCSTAGGIQWPFPEGRLTNRAANPSDLFADGRFYHADGKAKFLFDSPRPLPEAPSE